MTKLLIIFFITNMNFIYMMNLSIYKKMNPIIMGINLFIFTIISSLNLSFYYQNNIFSMLMFLIIIGGMMIIFMYFISTINNINMQIYKFVLWNFLYKFLLTTMLMLIIMNFYWNMNSWINPINLNSLMKMMKINILFNNTNIFSKIYMNYFFFSTILIMLYLMISMMMIAKMFMINKKLIRKFNYEKIHT